MASFITGSGGIQYPADSITLRKRHHRMSLAMPGKWLMPSVVHKFRSYTSVVYYGALVHQDYYSRYPRRAVAPPPNHLHSEVWYADERVLSVDASVHGMVTCKMYAPKGFRQAAKVAAAAAFLSRHHALKPLWFNWSSKKGIGYRGRSTYRQARPYAKDFLSFSWVRSNLPPPCGTSLLPYITVDGVSVEVPSLLKKTAQRRQTLSYWGAVQRAHQPNTAPHVTQMPLRFDLSTNSFSLQETPDGLDPLTGRRFPD